MFSFPNSLKSWPLITSELKTMFLIKYHRNVNIKINVKSQPRQKCPQSQYTLAFSGISTISTNVPAWLACNKYQAGNKRLANKPQTAAGAGASDPHLRGAIGMLRAPGGPASQLPSLGRQCSHHPLFQPPPLPRD